MGANHQKEIEFLCNIAKPDYGLITNFGKAHLEGFGGVEGVIKGKSEIYTHLIENNKMVFVNYNDTIQIDKTKEAKTFTFGNENQPVDVKINYKDARPFVTCEYEQLEICSQLIGDYNFNNMAIAITIGNYFKVNKEEIKSAIENYIPSNNRSQIIQKGTIKIILDAYNANPTSMKAALENFEKQKGLYKICILGDMFELGEDAEKEHQYIADLVSTMAFNHIVLIGKNFYKTKLVSPKVSVFKSFLDFKDSFNFSQLTDASLLIKGSRGMALERVLDYLE
jgi:UDP-N-acetylmuramoyl-tripeptide--D-alanyl-D-alanine ligase